MAKYIAAIEIGSSKIHGAIALCNDDGTLEVIASEVVQATNCVRHGRVSNVQEVSDLVNGIIRKLENNPAVMPHKVCELFIGLGGRSFTTVNAQASLDFAAESEITADIIRRLKKEAEFGLTTTKSVLDLLPRRYWVDNKEVQNMVGTFGSHVKVDFTAVICAQENRANLDRIKLDSAILRRRHYLLRPLAIADMVLDSNERQLGCMLVDFGAETTTLSIYKDGPLQFIVTLPLGSRHVTRDLMSGLKLTEDRAEQVKIELGNAINERPGGAPLSSEQVDINQYVHARTGEIIANVIHQAEAAGYKAADLPAGIIAVGGGIQLRNFSQLLSTLSKMRVRTGVADPRIRLCSGLDPDRDIDIIALLSAAAPLAETSCLMIDESAQQQSADDSTGSFGGSYDSDNRSDDYGSSYGSSYGSRTVPDEDDSNLLRDDPEDDEPHEERGSWFSRLLRRKTADERRQRLLDEVREDPEVLEQQRLQQLEQQRLKEEEAQRRRQDRQATRLRRQAENEVIDPMDDEADDDDDDNFDDYGTSRGIFDKFKSKVTSFLEKNNEANLDDRND